MLKLIRQYTDVCYGKDQYNHHENYLAVPTETLNSQYLVSGLVSKFVCYDPN